MSLFYGLAAGLFVSGSTWVAIIYVSEMAGICLGMFLLTFFVISAVYLTGDDLSERQKTLLKALTNTEVVFFERLKDVDYKVNRLTALVQAERPPAPPPAQMQTLDTLLTTLDDILASDTSVTLPTGETPRAKG
jgi:hypothetical protein